MSFNRISREEAIELIEELQAQNVRPANIRRRLIDEGFSYSEIYEMQGQEEYPYNNPAGKAKLKNDYQQYNNPPFERGGCLSAYLLLQVLGVVLSILVVCAAFSGTGSASSDAGGLLFFLTLFVLVVGGIQLLCVHWLWNGERKGYQGLLILGVIGAGLSLLAGNMPQFVGGLLGVVILYALVDSKSHQLT